MKNSATNTKDIFQNQLKNFKALLAGSKMAKLSAILLAAFSLVTAFKFRSNLEQAIPLLIGAIIQIVYTIKYLQVSDIKQKSYTQMSLQSSVSKFKEYMSNRKKYEMPVMALYAITLIPFALSNKSVSFVISVGVLGIALVSFLGMLAFKKVDSNIALLEATLKNELH
ncbi:hypothetical protein [uncultured Winogradskyella sp.]|uniref:hypothetical protein n=1 Tax=uncultured Winogradskyella sp. TaxID=395353 RepID=UPI0030EF6050|tara:strand:- start:7379 stop:7882 length:504 start_codon:yes stop_codon:yes gene_type:complete